jgi:hypothetical protein
MGVSRLSTLYIGMLSVRSPKLPEGGRGRARRGGTKGGVRGLAWLAVTVLGQLDSSCAAHSAKPTLAV